MYRKDLVKLVSENDLVNLFLYKWNLFSSKVRPTEFGLENVSLVVDDKYILQIIKPDKTKERLESVLSAISYLLNKGIDVPKVIPTNLGENYASLQVNKSEIYAILMEKIEGEHPRGYSKEQSLSVARAMARMHFRTAELSNNINKKNPIVFTIENYPKIDRNIIKNAEVQSFLDDMAKLKIDCTNCTMGLVHGDMHGENLLFRNTVLTGILDFDDFFVGPVVYDIAVYFFELNKYTKEQKWLDACRAFLKEYQRNEPLNSKDIDTLISFVKYRNFSESSFYGIYTGVDKFDWSKYVEFNNFIKTVDIQDIL